MLKNCLDNCYEVVKLIKFLLKREAMLKEIKKASELGSSVSGVCTLCPTRWTVRAQFRASILANYVSIQQLLESAGKLTSDTEMKACI